MNINEVCCNGCGGCIRNCPQNCISLKKDEYGFYKAYIDLKNCIDCGKCYVLCSSRRKIDACKKPLSFWAAYSKNKRCREKSTSGGIFSCVAEKVLESGGLVYGAAFSETQKLVHIRVSDVKDLQKLRGSKYLQSDAFSSYSLVQKDIQSGQIVLFSGTPCQIYGLKQFLRSDPTNLITIDIICHGVPSSELFYGYRKFLGNKWHGKIKEFYFRNKEKANDVISYTVKIVLEKKDKEKDIFISGDEDPYTLRFITNALQNSSCYECNFANLDRIGDITLGDYWGYQSAHPELRNENGVSLVLINTYKGDKLWRKLENITILPTSEELVRVKNTHLYKPADMNKDRNKIYEEFRKLGFSKKFYYSFFLPKGYAIYILKRRIKEILKL